MVINMICQAHKPRAYIVLKLKDGCEESYYLIGYYFDLKKAQAKKRSEERTDAKSIYYIEELD